MIADTTSSTATLVALVLGAGGVAGAVVAFVKLRPERDQIMVSAAQGAVIVQTGVIESLENENERQKKRIEELEGMRTAVRELTTQVQQMQSDRARCEEEIAVLRERLALVEEKNGGG